MNAKNWYKSKALWGAILVALSAGLRYLGYDEFATIMMSVGGALGIIGVRMGDKKLTK